MDTTCDADTESVHNTMDSFDAFIEGFFLWNSNRLIQEITPRMLRPHIEKYLTEEQIEGVYSNPHNSSDKLVNIVMQNQKKKLTKTFIKALRTCHPVLYDELFHQNQNYNPNVDEKQEVKFSSQEYETIEAIQELREKCQHLTIHSLVLEGFIFKGSEIASFLGKTLNRIPHLNTLEMRSINLDKMSLMAFTIGLQSLSCLKVFGNTMTAKDVNLIMENRELLGEISFDSCQTIINEFSCLRNSLISNTKIHTLEISGNFLSKANLKEIEEIVSSSDHLKSLYLKHNYLQDQDVKPLIKKLGEINKILKLSLNYNQLTDKTAILLAKLFPVKGIIRTLQMSSNQIATVGAQALAKHFKCKIDLRNNQVDVKNFNFPRHILLDNNHMGSTRVKIMLNRILDEEDFSQLVLNNIGLDDDTVKSLAEKLTRANLEMLILPNNSLTNNSLPSLVRLFYENKKIKEISLKGNTGIDAKYQILSRERPTDQAPPFGLTPEFWHLVSSSIGSALKLKHRKLSGVDVFLALNIYPGKAIGIEINECEIDDEGISHIKEYFNSHGSSVKTLKLVGGNLNCLSEFLVKCFKNERLQSVEFLNLSGIPFEFGMLKSLLEFASCETVILKPDPEQSMPAVSDNINAVSTFRINDKLKRFVLKNAPLSDEIGICLARSLSMAASVTYVDLTGTVAQDWVKDEFRQQGGHARFYFEK